MSLEKPICQALIVCDQLITDAATGKKTLVGIFNSLGAMQYPCVHPKFCVYVALTDGRGEYGAELRLINEGNQNPIVKAQGKINFPSPMDMLELNFEFVNVTFPEPGPHTIELYCDDELLTERRFTVVKIEQQQKPPHSSPQPPPPTEL
jgi:hypothetical protein